MFFARRFYPFLICLLWVSLLAAPACTNNDHTDTDKQTALPAAPVSGGTYKTPLRSNPATLDPAMVRDWYGESLVHQLFDGLVRFDSYLSIMPALAETWQVEDNGRLYRFFLRNQAMFHDGTPVTVDDVIFSLSRLLRVENAPVILPHLLKINGALEYRENRADRVEGLKQVDDHTLEVRLSEPHIPFLTALGMCYAKIVPKEAVTRLGDTFGKRPVGSGPFRFISWEPNTMIRLERFPEYYAEPSLLDEIHFRIYPGGRDDAILADFKTGNLAEMPVFGKVREALADRKDLQWSHRSSLSLFFYGMNCRHPNLANPDFRKALSMAIDRQELVSRVYNNQYDIATTILPPGMPGYTPVSRIPSNDMAMAGQLLQRYMETAPGPLPAIEIVSATQSPSSEAELGFVKESWERLGLSVEIKYITDWGRFEDYLKSDAVQIYRYAWFADMPEPDNFLYSLFGADSPANFMGYANTDVESMFTKARGTVGAVERAAMYQGIETLVLKTFPLIPLFYMSVDQVYQPHVKGIAVSALGAHTMTLNRIWIDQTP